jgi:hypothetical protein
VACVSGGGGGGGGDDDDIVDNLLEDSSHFSVSNALVVKSSGILNFSVINAGLWIRFS